jgi:hypothetical protein
LKAGFELIDRNQREAILVVCTSMRLWITMRLER